MKKLIIIISLISMTSCYVQKDLKPKILITHVLAVTETGDTLRLPIDMVKPNVYYNVINYGSGYYNRPYYNNWQMQPYYRPSGNVYVRPQNNNTNNNNNNTGSKPTPNPATSEQNADIRKKRGGN